MSNYILCIETSTTNCSVAISKNDVLVAIKEDNNAGYSHAEKLHVFIKEILEEAKIEKKELSAIVVSKGPGSYTGLRIGVSTTKGLCYALGVPLIAVNTLESMANQVVLESDSYIIPMLDARRMEVYTAIYNSAYAEIKPTSALILNEESYSSFLNEKACYFIGNGALKFKELCKHANANFMEEKFPSAKELIKIGYKKYINKQFEDVAYFEPFYLKDFVTTKKQG